MPEGAEGSKMLLFDERCDSSVDYGNSVQLIMLEDVASPLARRAVSVLLPAPLVATLPDARGLVREDKAGLADPVVVFMSGARVLSLIHI